MASTSMQQKPVRKALIRIAMPALLATATWLLPVRASAQAIFNQTPACGTQTMPSQDFTDLGGEVMAADDFVVPGGQSWALDRVAVFGALAEVVMPSNATYDVTIYNDSGGVPGTAVCSHTGLTSNTVTVAPGVEAGFQVDLPSVCNLGAGTYWLEIQAVVPSTSAAFFWESSTTANGNPDVWRDPNNIFGTGCTDWTTHTLCGPFGGPDPDLCLALFEQGAILDLAPPFVTLELDPVHLDPLANGTLTATASEIETGTATVVSIEYQLDGGSWMPMTAFDGSYDSDDESGVETISFVAEGVHEACARATDGLGNTSPPTCIDIGVGAAGDITGPATAISFSPIPIRALEQGALTATSSEVNTGGATIADIEYQLEIRKAEFRHRRHARGLCPGPGLAGQHGRSALYRHRGHRDRFGGTAAADGRCAAQSGHRWQRHPERHGERYNHWQLHHRLDRIPDRQRELGLDHSSGRRLLRRAHRGGRGRP
ncbi:MAG: choice-of-anchor R domain-containing protein [Acidobacteriota bacterium]